MSQKLCKLYIPRLMALLLCLTVLLTCAPVARAESGACGDGLTWEYSNGMLIISGSGAMYDYGSSKAVPWYSFRESITSVVLPSGLTSVGKLAFYGCNQLTTLSLPDKVRSVGEYAFAGCRQMQLLDLGSSLESIGTGAFYSCRGIVALRLPGTLKTIGSEAFYDCTGITSLTIPASVTGLGSAAFAYCTGLLRVDVQCPLTSLPKWAFFGCRQLSSVTLPSSVKSVESSTFQQCDNLGSISQGGSAVDKNSLEKDPNPPVPPQIGNSASGASGLEHPDGSREIQDTTVVENNNSTINTKTEYSSQQNDLTVSTDITVTVENDKGWEEVQPALKDALDAMDSFEEGTIVRGNDSVTIYVKDTEGIDQSFVETLAGRDMTVTFISKDGSVWQVKGTDLNSENSEVQGYDLRYDLKPGSEELCMELLTSWCYELSFRENGQINAQVMIRLNPALVMHQATLLRREDGEMKRMQTSVIDKDGFAYFYLGSVEKDTQYYVAIDLPKMPGAEEAPVIIPEEVLPAYGNVINYQPVQYEITGRTSSWDMNLGQVMGILAAVMIGAVALIGGIMFLWNKQRLKSGYVPQWDDEEESL